MRALVVDDEPHARRKLATFLSSFPGVVCVGEAGDGVQALAKIEELRPDVVLLDIQMPGLNGLEVAARVSGQIGPHLIFTTAYDEHAIRAFELAAVDYLLKPFDRARLQQALERVHVRSSQAASDPVILRNLFRELVKEVHGGESWRDQRLLVKSGANVRFLEVNDIQHIEAEGDYVAIRLGDESLLVRERLKNLEERLTPHGFVRVHRSVLLNLAYVQEMRPYRHGDYEFVMRSGRRFVSSPGHRDGVKALLRDAQNQTDRRAAG